MNNSILKKLISIIVALSIFMQMLHIGTASSFAAGTSAVRSADEGTINKWQELFINPSAAGVELTTENAGGVWTDKSVFTADSVPAEILNAGYTNSTTNRTTHPSITDKGDNFLVSLSAIAANKEITGYSTIPTDTVFVLDMSSSMQRNDNNGGSAIDELADATNKAITKLLDLNRNNRIAVVLYSGNVQTNWENRDGRTTVLLPLDSYTTSTTYRSNNETVNQYIDTYNSNLGITVDDGVKNSDGNSVEKSMISATGTFTQDGIYEAMRLLLNVEDTKIESGVQAGTTRMPIMVLMTDGEPTMANEDYNGNAAGTDLGTSKLVYSMSSYYDTRDSIAFLTQLTAAYAKREITQHYGEKALFYTLSYGRQVTTLDEAISVMDPEQTSDAIMDYWNSFIIQGRAAVHADRYNSANSRVYAVNDTAEPLVAADRLYVDEYFPATTDQEMLNAFQSIVDEIILQSKYYPTYVTKDHDHDGYITFTDKIGGYMEVTDIKGFVIGDNYYSGAALASGFTADPEDSIFGTVENPNPLGDNLVWSVQERLGIPTATEARALLEAAFTHGQLAYTDDRNFSNYIGWYSDKDGNYLDFWYDGITTAPPANATHIIKSYGFLGATDEEHGISNTDMMYTSVRISKELDDYDGDGIPGETFLVLQVPASLIPTITYKVDVRVDEDGNIEDVDRVYLESENVKPMRLLYEVELRGDIHDWNITEKVSEVYTSSTANKDEGYVFYTNQWERGTNYSSTARNTYSHFEPSAENERYYYTADTPIYTAENTNSRYVSASEPDKNGVYYRAFNVYEKMVNGTYRMHTHFERISAQSLELAENTNPSNPANGNWYIPKGTIHLYLEEFENAGIKQNPVTGTMPYVDFPTIVEKTENNIQHYYTYDVLGNNGRLEITPATGIKLTKTLSEAVSGALDEFTFAISGDNVTATVIRLDANGEEASREDLVTNDTDTFTLSAGETVYIVGLTDGGTYTVREITGEVYKVEAVNVNGSSVTGTTATIVAADRTVQTAEFINAPKGYGNLYIVKEIHSDHQIPNSILTQNFEVSVKVGIALAGGQYTVRYPDATQIDGYAELKATVDNAGYLKVNGANLSIPRNNSYEIMGLPEETVVTVAEILSAEQDKYFEDYEIRTLDHSGGTADNDGKVTITKNANSTAVITNTYTPESSDAVVIDVAGTKNFDGLADYMAGNGNQDITFNFKVEKWNSANNVWDTVTTKTASVTYTSADTNETKTFQIEDVLNSEVFDKVGVHTYQIIEDRTNPVSGVTYDTTTHTITITVTDNNGKLEATVTGHHEDAITQSGGQWTANSVFNNSYNTASITIDTKKTVENNSGNPEKDAPAGFIFNMYNATVEGGNWVKGSSIDHQVTDAAGEARFTAVYSNAQVGKHYYIIEETDQGKAGWTYDSAKYYVTVNVTTDGTNPTATIESISKDGATAVTVGEALVFENTYDPEDVKLNLNAPVTVRKSLEGRTLEANQFTFWLYENGGSYNASEKNNLVGKNNAAGEVIFDKQLEFDRAGIYEFDIKEYQANDLGYSYDSIIYDLVVEVADNDGILVVSDYYFEDSVLDYVTFNNSYTTYNVTHIIDGVKTLAGRPMLNAEFRFNLTQVTDATGNTEVQNGLKLIAENGPVSRITTEEASFAFEEITFTQADIGKTYYYRIDEVHGGDTLSGVTYDNTKYVVALTVKDNGNGTLSVEENIVSGGSEIKFSNTYTAKPTDKTFGATKEISGRTLNDGEFYFNLYETDSTYDITSASAKLLETVRNTAEGIISFTKQEYSTAGTRYYVVNEAAGSLGGVTYDQTRYHIEVEVYDNTRGNLVAVSKITKYIDAQDAGVLVDHIVFSNIYLTQDEVIDIPGKKFLEGRNTVADEFKFLLYAADDRYVPITTEQPVVAKNDQDGNFKFEDITFDQPGTYYFVAMEDDTVPIERVTFDKTEFNITVTVEDNGLGNLVAKTPVIEKVNPDGSKEPASEIVFNNIFTPKPADIEVNVTAKKTVENKGNQKITAEGFEFTLTDVATNIGTTEMSGADGLAVFTLKYSEEDIGKTYKYTLSEVDQGKEYITYSTAVHTVKVEVSLDTATNKLVAKVSANENEVENAVLDFVNIYDLTKLPAINIVKSYSIKAADGTPKSGSQVIAGDRITYTLKVSNSGDAEALNSVITDKIPEGLILENAKDISDGGSENNGVISWNIGTITSGASKEVSFTVTVPDNKEGATFKNVATVTYNKDTDEDGDIEEDEIVTEESNMVETVLEKAVEPEEPTPVIPAPTVPESPKTGDLSNVWLWIALFFVSGGTIIGTQALRKKENE